VPKLSVATVVLLFLCCIGLFLARGGDAKSLFKVDATLALFAVTAAYLLLNATWSLDHERAVASAVWFIAVVLMSYAGCRALARWPERSLRMAATAFLAGVGIGVAVILFEAATDRLGTLALYKSLPFTQPDSLKGFVVRDGEIVRIALTNDFLGLSGGAGLAQPPCSWRSRLRPSSRSTIRPRRRSSEARSSSGSPPYGPT